MEQHSGVWNLAAPQWSGAGLSCTLKVVYPTLLGLLISALEPLMPSGGIFQESNFGGSCSGDMAVLITCADILGISPCQICLL